MIEQINRDWRMNGILRKALQRALPAKDEENGKVAKRPGGKETPATPSQSHHIRVVSTRNAYNYGSLPGMVHMQPAYKHSATSGISAIETTPSAVVILLHRTGQKFNPKTKKN